MVSDYTTFRFFCPKCGGETARNLRAGDLYVDKCGNCFQQVQICGTVDGRMTISGVLGGFIDEPPQQ